jgi:hypothetical protein
MEEWVERALQRWPNVPALFGWLKLDRRGRWLIQDETISRLQIIDVINRNYDCDEHGRWYFQNGPQRGYMQLERAPLLICVTENGTALQTHNQLRVAEVSQAFMDEEGGLFLTTEHGPGAMLDSDLDWALANMFEGDRLADERDIDAALALRSGQMSELTLQIDMARLPIFRLDNANAPERLHFVRDPQP